MNRRRRDQLPDIPEDPDHGESVPSHIADLRKFVRVQLNTRGWCRCGDAAWEPCTVSDVSGGGAQIVLIRSTVHVQQGSLITLRFRIGTEYLLAGQVVWTEASAHQLRLGMSWVSISEADRERLVLELMRIAIRRRRYRIHAGIRE